MNSSIAGVIDTLRNNSGATTSQGIAHLVEVVHQACTSAAADKNADGGARGEFNKWLIVAAAVVGGFFLLRGMRKLMKLAFAMFWIWMFTRGHGHQVFGWW